MNPTEYLFWLGEHVPKGQEGTGIVSPVKPETKEVIRKIVRDFYIEQERQISEKCGWVGM